jgi:hypothetical protein
MVKLTNATIEIGYDYGIAEIIDDALPGVSIDCTDEEAAGIKTGKSNSSQFTFNGNNWKVAAPVI